MIFTKEISEKLIAAHEHEVEENPKVISKIRNIAGPGVFYAIDGFVDAESGKFSVYGLSNIDFATGRILEYPATNCIVFAEDFETLNIPYGHVLFEIDHKFEGRVSDAMKELNIQ